MITALLIAALFTGEAAAGVMVCKPECVNGNKVYNCVDENGRKIKQYAYDKLNVPTKCEDYETD